jgi:hypothetical protein
MGQTDQEPNPRRRVPTFLWMALSLVAVLAFVVMAVAIFRPHPPQVFAPPAGSPPTH